MIELTESKKIKIEEICSGSGIVLLINVFCKSNNYIDQEYIMNLLNKYKIGKISLEGMLDELFALGIIERQKNQKIVKFRLKTKIEKVNILKKFFLKWNPSLSNDIELPVVELFPSLDRTAILRNIIKRRGRLLSVSDVSEFSGKSEKLSQHYIDELMALKLLILEENNQGNFYLFNMNNPNADILIKLMEAWE